MPAKSKKIARREAKDFEDMLAEFQAQDILDNAAAAAWKPTIINATSFSASSSMTKISKNNKNSDNKNNKDNDNNRNKHKDNNSNSKKKDNNSNDSSSSSSSIPTALAVLEEPMVPDWVIIEACKKNDVDQLQRWGRQGVRLMSAIPLLLCATHRADLALVRCLVNELSASVDQGGQEGISPLMIAASAGDLDLVRCLIEELGADVSRTNMFGVPPLISAAAGGMLDVVRFLLASKADINIASQNGMTALMIASGNCHHETVRWLVKAGADVKAVMPKDAHTAGTAADIFRTWGASAEQQAYLDAKTHCSNPDCSGAGCLRCTGCKQARYCGERCQLAHWKAHKDDCRRWSAELDIVG
jgi:hypothetical protein